MKLAFRTAIVSIYLACCTTLMADSRSPGKSELTYAIYSDSSAEIFWTRSTDDSISLIYRLERNGDLVYVGDGLSFNERGLKPTQRYVYSLTVIDEDGLVSETDTISFSTTDSASLSAAIVLPPQGLHVATYSSSAMELTWQRIHNTALQYEVSQDGSVIGTTVGTSFYIDSGVESGRSYTFDIVAIRTDASGQKRSLPRSQIVTMPGQFALSRLPPTKPRNIQFVRYSSTAAELFWDRQPVEQRVVATDVFRNDGLLMTVPGNSFFDDSRISGQDYDYALVSITQTGERSEVAFYPPNENEPSSDDFIVDETNMSDFLATVSAIVSGEKFDGILDDALTIGRFENTAGLQLSSVFDDGTNFLLSSRYECIRGGQLTIDVPTNTQRMKNSIFMNDCSLNDASYHGDIVYESNVPGFSVTADLVRRISFSESGYVLGTFTLSPEESKRSINISRYSMTDENDVNIRINYYKTKATYETDDSRHTEPLTLSTSWLAKNVFGAGLTIIASTDKKFDRSEGESFFTQGTLVITFSDSDSYVITLEADNGDTRTFQLTVDQGNAVNAYTINWDDTNRLF